MGLTSPQGHARLDVQCSVRPVPRQNHSRAPVHVSFTSRACQFRRPAWMPSLGRTQRMEQLDTHSCCCSAQRHSSAPTAQMTLLATIVLVSCFALADSAIAADGLTTAATPPAGNQIQQFLQSALDYIQQLGPAGPAVFVLIYVVSCILLIPASILTLGAGAIYGPLQGLALVSLASTLGCTAAFLTSRYVARPFAQERLLGTEKFQQIDRGIARKGPYLVFLLRLSPLVPFGLLNYCMGLTSVELVPYIGASWLGMLPGTFAYVYLGSVGSQTLNAASGGISTAQLALYGVGAIASLAAVREISKFASSSIGDLDEEPLVDEDRQP